jgi:hypothetical protein
MSDAVRSLRTMFFSSLVILIVWGLAWPSALEKYALYRDVRDLHAWLHLRDQIAGRDWATIDEAEFGEEITCVPSGEPKLPCDPLSVRAVWPTVSTFSVSLRPKLNFPAAPRPDRFEGRCARVYAVFAGSERLPVGDYEVVVIPQLGEAYALPANDEELYRELNRFSDASCGLRQQAIAARTRARPSSWTSLAPHLARYGALSHPTNLRLSAPELWSLTGEADPSKLSVQLFGISIPIGLFLAAAGLILGVNAFAMVGPLLALRRAERAEAPGTWIMVAPTTGEWPAQVLESLILLVSFLWVMAPIAVLALQLTTDLDFRPLEAVALSFGMLGAVVASVTHLAASVRLRALRRR